MRGNRAWVGIVVLGCAFAWTAEAAENPPAQWADYVAGVRKAEAIVDDEARCLATPDLPGNQWRPGAASGRCSILRKPAWSLDDVERLLATPEGVAELERGFAALLDAHYNDQTKRDQIFVAFDVFDASDRAGQIAARWLKLAPKSPFALTAAGAHYGTSGWEARGERWISKTPQEQLVRMSGFFSQAVPLYLQALEAEPRLGVACYKLNAIGRQSSDELQQFAMAYCTKVDPDSYFMALERIMSAKPRWGGSDEELRFAVAYAAARTERNPMLGALLGEAAGDIAARADDYGVVADDLAAAARMGPSADLSSKAGDGYWSRGDAWAALAYLSQGVRFRPNDADARYSRAAVLHDLLGDSAWARSDMEVALKEEPGDSRMLNFMGRIVQQLDGYVAARPYFKQAMVGESRPGAMELYCQTYLVPKVELDAANACTRDLVTEFPKSGEGWRLRTWTLYEAHDPAVVEAFDQFARYADQSPRLQHALETMRTDWGPTLERLRSAGKPSDGSQGR